MKFGIVCTTIWGRNAPPEQQINEHRDLVKAADQLGFDVVVAGQHYLGTELRYYQPVPYLLWLSQFTQRMQIATGIILLPLVHPVDMAEQMATFDVLTGGRSIFGVGLGYSPHEFKAFGVTKGSRVERFEENLELIKALWTGDEVNFHGKYVTVEGVVPSVLPLQRPRPAIWVAGQVEAAVKRAARMGDAWYAPPFPTHQGLARLRGLFLEERARVGLPAFGDFPLRRELVIAGPGEDSRRLAAMRSAGRFDTYIKWGLTSDLDKDATGFGSKESDDIDARFIHGTPEQCAEALAGLRDKLGMTHFMYKPQWPGLPHADVMKQLELFGTRVIPLLRK